MAQFVDAVRQVAAGGTAMDPEVVAQLLSRRAADEPLAALTPREREVLGLMAEGRSNAAIAARLFITEKAVSKHTNNIFADWPCRRPRTTTAGCWRSWPTSTADRRPAPDRHPPAQIGSPRCTVGLGSRHRRGR